MDVLDNQYIGQPASVCYLPFAIITISLSPFWRLLPLIFDTHRCYSHHVCWEPHSIESSSSDYAYSFSGCSVERFKNDQTPIRRPSRRSAYLPRPDALLTSNSRPSTYLTGSAFGFHSVAEHSMPCLLLGRLLSRIPSRLQGINNICQDVMVTGDQWTFI